MVHNSRLIRKPSEVSSETAGLLRSMTARVMRRVPRTFRVRRACCGPWRPRPRPWKLGCTPRPSTTPAHPGFQRYPSTLAKIPAQDPRLRELGQDRLRGQVLVVVLVENSHDPGRPPEAMQATQRVGHLRHGPDDHHGIRSMDQEPRARQGACWLRGTLAGDGGSGHGVPPRGAAPQDALRIPR